MIKWSYRSWAMEKLGDDYTPTHRGRDMTPVIATYAERATRSMPALYQITVQRGKRKVKIWVCGKCNEDSELKT
jgi:hypothetical protein